MIGGRYRIVGLLGRGGMGEVYRADDLKLGQAVALKFLPAVVENDAGRLQRFLNEVKIARQISHPSVCRVYDLGEVNGLHYLSMEYVDGEDLASLLRRIGRLPKDKAVEISRQLCAGLAAAHEQGILHRDLKPANIMIDGRGRAKITDFGLATLAGTIRADEFGAGTPQYMAPEQRAGKEVTVRSDIYALGLVLYELFSGKPAFRAASVDELRRLQSETTPSSPSSFVEGFDPTVERVLLRCLEAEPARRPASALAIAAALPGGDPLAAALAAGETPSPEMVAEAGGKEAASPALSWGALGLFIAALIGCVALSSQTTLLGLVPLDKPPEVLRERGREILAQAGYDKKPADSLFAFATNWAYLREAQRTARPGADRWNEIRSLPPSGILFWYRESPSEIVRINSPALGGWMWDPPVLEPGEARLALDPEGRLVSLLVVPGEKQKGETAAAETDWEPLLRATGVDAKTVAPATPEWAPPVFADRRAAWTASWPGKPDLPLRIEAASVGGRPVSLRLVEPWTRPSEEPATPKGFWSRAAQLVNTFWFLTVVIVAGVVALRNVRRGRGDRRGALRFALYLGAVRMLWYIGAHHTASPAELGIFMGHLSYAMQRFGLAYVFYLAIEPYARRLWPKILVSWVRLLEGRLRDPLVGRDLLIGCAAGALSVLTERLSVWISGMMAGTSALPAWGEMTSEALRGTVASFVAIMNIHTREMLDLWMPVTMFLIMRLLLRRTSLAAAAVTLLALVMFYPQSGDIITYMVVFSIRVALFWVVLLRFGLLPLAAMFSISALMDQMPLTTDPSGWYLGAMLLALGFIAAPALWGFWTSQAGRPLFRDEVLEPRPPGDPS